MLTAVVIIVILCVSAVCQAADSILHPYRDQLTPQSVAQRTAACEDTTVVIGQTVYEGVSGGRVCELLKTEQWQPCGQQPKEGGLDIVISSAESVHVYDDGVICVDYLADQAWYNASADVFHQIESYAADSAKP